MAHTHPFPWKMLPKIKRCIRVQNLSFIAALSTAALLHTKPTSTKTPHDNCHAQCSDRRNALLLV